LATATHFHREKPPQRALFERPNATPARRGSPGGVGGSETEQRLRPLVPEQPNPEAGVLQNKGRFFLLVQLTVRVTTATILPSRT